jgi:hypothetical protein
MPVHLVEKRSFRKLRHWDGPEKMFPYDDACLRFATRPPFGTAGPPEIEQTGNVPSPRSPAQLFLRPQLAWHLRH